MLSQDRNKVTWSPRWRGPAYVSFLHFCTVSLLQALKFLGSIKIPQKHYQLFTSRTVLAMTAPRGNRLVCFSAVPGFRDILSGYLSALTTKETAAPRAPAKETRHARSSTKHLARRRVSAHTTGCSELRATHRPRPPTRKPDGLLRQ